jgi:hypothetical protein
MKNIKPSILFVIVVLSLASCVTVGPSIKLYGRWQDTENPSFSLEFTDDYGFREFFNGEVIGYGEIYPVDSETIRLHYLSPCGGENEVSCDVNLKYTVTEETLIITDNQGDLVFTKME